MLLRGGGDVTARHELLLAALRSAGFTDAAHGRGYVRVAWPHDRETTLMVVTDASAPEYGPLLDAAVATLEQLAARGRVAQRVLDALLPDSPIA